MLVVLPFLAPSRAVPEQAQVPRRRHAAVTHFPAQKLHQPGNEKTRLRRVFRQGTYRRNQFRRQSLVGVQMQLPRVTKRKVVDGPVSLRAIIFKLVLDDLRSKPAAQLDRIVRAEGIDNVNVIGDFSRLRQRISQRIDGIKCKNDDRGLHAGVAISGDPNS